MLFITCCWLSNRLNARAHAHCPCPMQRLDPRQITRKITECQDLGDLGRVVAAHGVAFNYIHVPAALTSFQRLVRGSIRPEGPAAALMAQLVTMLRQKTPELGAQGVSNSLNALAKLERDDDPGLVSALITRGHAELRTFTEQALANTIWAMATLGHQDPAFTTALLVEARNKLPTFNEQNLANTIWAMAKLGNQDPAFTSALLVEAGNKLPTFNEQNLANTIWAMAKLGHQDPAFTNALLVEARNKLPAFNAQELASTLWAMEKLGHQDPAFTKAVAAFRKA